MKRLHYFANIVISKRAGLLELAGVALFLSGCYCVWAPLPLLVGGVGLLGLGFLFDYLAKE